MKEKKFSPTQYKNKNPKKAKRIVKAVKKAVKEYGTTFKLLAAS